MKISFIGGGNMGEAMLAAVLEKKLASPPDVTVSDTRPERLDYLKERFNVGVTQNNAVAAGDKEVVVLAVKPQSLVEVMAGLKGKLTSSQVVLSIIAGTKIETITRGLGHGRVVRAMPNTPAQVGAGVSAWTATGDVATEQKAKAQSVLAATGREIYFGDESYLDMATAVSGSGPAYFFLLAESLVEAAVVIGLPREAAEVLVSQTMLGAGQLLVKSGKTPAELRRNVTSPGGTTAAALGVFDKGDFPGLVARAVKAAHDRAIELGRQS